MLPSARLTYLRALGRWHTRLLARHAVHQDTTLTWPNRYPRLFAAARDLLGGEGGHRLLSFGCAAGDEVMSLRGYFPHAAIIGAEINRAELAACRRLPADPAITFVHSRRDRVAALGPYDAVFCLAVLQRRPHAVERDGVTDLTSIYPFARFADEVAFLASQLRSGGLLVVEHSQYRVEDAVPRLLEPVVGVGDWLAKGPRFDHTGALIRPQPAVSRLFRRRSTTKHETIV